VFDEPASFQCSAGPCREPATAGSRDLSQHRIAPEARITLRRTFARLAGCASSGTNVRWQNSDTGRNRSGPHGRIRGRSWRTTWDRAESTRCERRRANRAATRPSAPVLAQLLSGLRRARPTWTCHEVSQFEPRRQAQRSIPNSKWAGRSRRHSRRKISRKSKAASSEFDLPGADTLEGALPVRIARAPFGRHEHPLAVVRARQPDRVFAQHGGRSGGRSEPRFLSPLRFEPRGQVRPRTAGVLLSHGRENRLDERGLLGVPTILTRPRPRRLARQGILRPDRG
jgi:hypothetical protein